MKRDSPSPTVRFFLGEARIVVPSMGRLTLNVLLSFAQFEHEVTGERIRDKIAASKQKGMWMGGFVPLGCGVCDRRIVIDEGEAETVRYISGATRSLDVLLRLIPHCSIQDRFVLPEMAEVFVTDFTDVNLIREQRVKCAARE
jgi:hypothetical protein